MRESKTEREVTEPSQDPRGAGGGGVAGDSLPPVTIVIEWENAIDVEDAWTKKAMQALAEELRANAHRFSQKPRVTYLFNPAVVDAATIPRSLREFAPGLMETAEVEIVPAPGRTYYELKNYGVSRADSEVVILLDSDAGPRPGWLDGLLAPFRDDPEVVAVGGFTVLGWDDVLSKAMALSWIFNLPSERSATEKRSKIHSNNCAFRTAFMKQHPYPTVPGSFKKACGFHLRELKAGGYKWVRTARAMTVHAPHPGLRFLVWRAMCTGLDRDVQVYHTVTRSRLGRLGYAVYHFVKKTGRAWGRILRKGGEVELAIWQRPLAMLYALAFYSILFGAELYSAVVRRIEAIPATKPLASVEPFPLPDAKRALGAH